MKREFEKNRLDLAYQRQLTHLNAVLFLATTGLISFIGTFIWNKDYLVYGFLILIAIFLISIFWYIKINKTIKGISLEIKNL